MPSALAVPDVGHDFALCGKRLQLRQYLADGVGDRFVIAGSLTGSPQQKLVQPRVSSLVLVVSGIQRMQPGREAQGWAAPQPLAAPFASSPPLSDGARLPGSATLSVASTVGSVRSCTRSLCQSPKSR